MGTDEMKDTAYASYIIWRSTVISVNCRYICKLSILDNHKYKSLNRQIIRAIDIPVYLLNRQGIVVKLLNTPTEKANRLPFLNPGVLNINNLVTDADECRKYMTSLLRVLNTRTSDSLTLKIRIESGEKLYIAVRMVYLNRNYVIAFIRDITEDEVQRR